MSMIDGDTDPRLVEYIEALRAHDVDKAIELRLIYSDDPALKVRFKTVESVFTGILDTYTKEIQILRLELDGWKAICEGQDTLAEEGVTNQEKQSANQLVKRGLEKTERALLYRKKYPAIEDLPKLSRDI